MTLMAKERKQRQRRNRPVTIYGRFLQWVAFRYNLTQAQLAEIMGTSQSTVSNWQVGTFEASWKANARMADELKFDARLRDLLALVFTYGQGTPAPVEEPADFPYSLAREVGVVGAGADPRFPGGAETERDFEQGLDAEEQVRRARRNAERGESGPTPGDTST